MTEDEILNEIVRRLVDAVHPDRIILYGSRARGDARPDSDYDLLVIAPSDQERWKRTTGLYHVFEGLGISYDIVWYTQEEVDEWREVKSHFITKILHDGKVLCSGGAAPAAKAPPVAKTPLDHARTWLQRAAEQADASQRLLEYDHDLNEAVCLHAHEAAEASLRAVLAVDDVVFGKTHDLRTLLDLAIPRVPQLRGMEDRLLALASFAFDVRDDLADEPDEPTARAALDTAREVYDLAARLVRERDP